MSKSSSENGEVRTLDYIAKISTDVVKTSGEFANTDSLVASIVYRLITEGVSRKLIDAYFLSEESVLRGRYKPTVNKNGW